MALDAAKCGAHRGTTISALRQSAGRGRKGRGWESLAGNVHLSLISDCRGDSWTEQRQLLYVAGVAVADAVQSLLQVRTGVALKWPNDVVVGRYKVAGILIEQAADGRMVIGVGINLAALPKDVGRPVTTLRMLGSQASHCSAVDACRRHLLDAIGCLAASGFTQLRRRWLDLASDLGREIEVSLSGTPVRGTLADVDGDGVAILMAKRDDHVRLSTQTVRVLCAPDHGGASDG